MAGRNQRKLEELRQSLPQRARDVPLRVVDATNEVQMQSLAKEAKVVANFAGTPFYDKAIPVVKACVESGRCYVDITGETPLMKVSADRFDARARETGSLIVHACGYDSVPFDFGALLAAKEMRARYGVGCTRIRSYEEDAEGGVSGGTLKTLTELSDNNMEGSGALEDPYGLDPPGGKRGPDVGDGGEVGILPVYDSDVGSWTAPSVMASINARVVRRSNALLGYAYGDRMSYGEVAGGFKPLTAVAYVAALLLGGSLVAQPLTRRALLSLGVLPSPGQGPSRQLQDEGFFKTRTVALGEGSPPPRVVAHVESGNGGDPGYKCTARMACEAALCAALERDRCYRPGGVVTPAVAFGDVLVERLNASGMRLYVDPAV